LLFSAALGAALVAGIATASGRALLAPLVATLADDGRGVTSIEVKEPNLEDLFLSLTGTSLRD